MGTIRIGDVVVFGPGRWVPPQSRRIGYVAQEGALFPHLTVGDNIGFGLSQRGPEAARTIHELLELVDLDPSFLRRYPHQLSGGQQQRVALARTLAARPAIVLLDEPFASLDAGLREGTRAAIMQALATTRTTAVLVTHDQPEALSVADQVAVMFDGEFEQVLVVREGAADSAVAARVVRQTFYGPIARLELELLATEVALMVRIPAYAGLPAVDSTVGVVVCGEGIGWVHGDSASVQRGDAQLAPRQ